MFPAHGLRITQANDHLLSVSVHPDRGARVVRWRDNGAQRARRFKTQAEAVRRANAVPFGLYASVWTDSPSIARASLYGPRTRPRRST